MISYYFGVVNNRKTFGQDKPCIIWVLQWQLTI